MAIKRELQQQIQRLHVISALVFAALAVAAGWLMKPTSYPFVVGHATKDELASQTTTVFAPAISHLVDIDMRWVAIALMVLGIITALMASVYWRAAYTKQLGNRLSPLTWISLGGVIPALMVETVAIFSGAQDILFLKSLVALTLLSGLFCFLAERENRGARSPQLVNFWLALATGLVPWLVLVVMLVGTPLYGMVRMPWFVYGLFGVLTLASIAAFANLWHDIKGKGWARDFGLVERNYLVINLLAKSAFVILLIVGLSK